MFAAAKRLAALLSIACGLVSSTRAESILYTPSVSEVDLEYVTLFAEENFTVTAVLEWSELDTAYSQGDVLYWQLSLNDEFYSSGTESVNSSRVLPSEIDCGEVIVGETGTVSITVEVSLDSTFSDSSVTSSGDASAQAINRGASIVPLIIVLVLAIALQKVEIALVLGVFVGSCMVSGDLINGFRGTFSTYLLNSVSDVDHQFVILFSLFLSGLVAMMQRTGGANGLTTILVKIAKTSRWAQVIALCSGVLIFFDDYTNTLVIGNTMRPILDNFVSREKTAWITDATSAPIASISPISSWVGYEVSLIQTELDRIIDDNGGVAPEGLPTNGYAVFLQTISYRYYPVYLIVFQLSLALMQRDFGPMLIAERKVFVTGRTDGGDGAMKGASANLQEIEVPKGTPIRAYNMLIPIALLIFFVFWLLVTTGRESSDADADFLTVIQNSDSYTALLIGTVGTAACSMVLYAFQFTKNGRIVPPTPKALWALLNPCKKKHPEPATTTEEAMDDDKIGIVENQANLEKHQDDAEDRVHSSANGEENSGSAYTSQSSELSDDLPKPLLGPVEAFEVFIRGIINLFPAIIVLVLAWTIGSIMTDVGCDRLFSRAIENNFNVGYLPTITFIISAFMAIAMGSSWSVMTIVFPLVTRPAWIASEGDLNIFYGTMAAVLAGSVLGDHASPISDTTVLSCLASRCDLTAHVRTQAPYAATIGIVSIICGTIPVGTGGYDTGAGMGVGIAVTIAVAFLLGAPVRCPSGRFDILTELYILITRDANLKQLKVDTARVATELYGTMPTFMGIRLCCHIGGDKNRAAAGESDFSTEGDAFEGSSSNLEPENNAANTQSSDNNAKSALATV